LYVNNGRILNSDFSIIEVVDIETFTSIKRFDKVTGIRFMTIIPEKLQLFSKLNNGPLIKVFEMDRKFENLNVVGHFDASEFRLYGSFLRDTTRGLMYYAHLGGLQVIHEEYM